MRVLEALMRALGWVLQTTGRAIWHTGNRIQHERSAITWHLLFPQQGWRKNYEQWHSHER